MNDGRTSYILGFYRPDENPQTPMHRIEVRVNRPGVTLRYRTSYTVEPPPAKSSDPVRDVVLAMNRPVDATAVGMTASVTHAGPSRLNLSVTFDITNLNLELNQGQWTGKAEFVAHFETVDDKQAGGATARTLTFWHNSLVRMLAGQEVAPPPRTPIRFTRPAGGPPPAGAGP